MITVQGIMQFFIIFMGILPYFELLLSNFIDLKVWFFIEFFRATLCFWPEVPQTVDDLWGSCSSYLHASMLRLISWWFATTSWEMSDIFFLELCSHIYVTINIGEPAKEYNLDVDTGSILTWLQCHDPNCRGDCRKVHWILHVFFSFFFANIACNWS